MVKLSPSIVYGKTKTTVDLVKKLNLWGCNIDDIELCAQMKNLQVLSLSVNRVKSLEPLKECDKLEELYLRKNEIEDLKELEHLKNLEKLRVLRIDENPCTSDNGHRMKVLRILPQVTKLDDKVVTQEDLFGRAPSPDTTATMECSPPSVRLHRHSVSSSSHHLPQQQQFDMTQSLYHPTPACSGGAIVDSVHPMINPMLSMSTSQLWYGSEADEQTPRCSYSNLMTQSMVTDDDGLRHVFTEESEENTWNDFSIEEEPPCDLMTMSQMQMQNPMMFQSLYEGSQSARQSRGYRVPLWAQPGNQRSVSMPRRRFNTRSQSISPARQQRVENIMNAISVLLDELDPDGLRRVIDEAQKRIKKHK
ncbi:hypothetical protein L596_017193 [Steinernema carpocapsae]|uniref:U2A'/phosphoprotein 32 family A C-terminal domain-containing protein n=1 Tax=Steinernema carpocapsae TaxID=34508 RepID=A0A4U5N158_STECR|nr:hypothetical protein L596_017193 [Steinernema carpocapsae]